MRNEFGVLRMSTPAGCVVGAYWFVRCGWMFGVRTNGSDETSWRVVLKIYIYTYGVCI